MNAAERALCSCLDESNCVVHGSVRPVPSFERVLARLELEDPDLPHHCPIDGVTREWSDLTPAWKSDADGLDGAHCPGCGTTLCLEVAS